jgi:hypothetical protein
LALDVRVITLMNYLDIERFHLAFESNVTEHDSGSTNIQQKENLYTFVTYSFKRSGTVISVREYTYF